MNVGRKKALTRNTIILYAFAQQICYFFDDSDDSDFFEKKLTLV